MEDECHEPDVYFTGGKKGKGKEKGKKERYRDIDKVKAVWRDENHAIFVRICIEQMRMGNKPGQTLNKEGYRNLEKEFLKETGLHYVKSQFKNHWDNTRRDWLTWNALKNSPEVDWNPKKNTFSQSRQWWAEFAKQFYGGDKFAIHPLKHEEELNLLFGGTVATNDIMVMPISAKKPQVLPVEALIESPVDNMTGDQCQEGAIPLPEEDITSTPAGSARVVASPICSARYSSTPIWLTNVEDNGEASPRQCSNCQPQLSRPGKRAKTVVQRCEASMKQVHNLLAEVSKTLASSVNEEPNPMLKAMELLNTTTGIERNSDEWLFAASLLRDQSTRQLFVALGDPESRSAWIKREYRLAHKS